MGLAAPASGCRRRAHSRAARGHRCGPCGRKMPDELASEAGMPGKRAARSARRPRSGGVDRVVGLLARRRNGSSAARARSRRGGVVLQRQPLRDREAEPVHAGVDVDRRRAASRLRRGRSRPIRSISVREPRTGRRRRRAIGRRGAGQQAVEHVDAASGATARARAASDSARRRRCGSRPPASAGTAGSMPMP